MTVTSATPAAAGPPQAAAPEAAATGEERRCTVQAVHCVRTMILQNMALSQMADQKASLLMAATFVVFTISVGQASHGHLPVSLIILALSAFLSALCAVLAVLPVVQPPSLPPGRANFLFFGVFSLMSEEEFAAAVIAELETEERMFRMMLRDVHQNGMVLQRKKYRFLGLAYQIFLTGLTLTVIAFVIEYSVFPFH